MVLTKQVAGATAARVGRRGIVGESSLADVTAKSVTMGIARERMILVIIGKIIAVEILVGTLLCHLREYVPDSVWKLTAWGRHLPD
jgi:hypothetical protein